MDHLADIRFVCGLVGWLLVPIFYHIFVRQKFFAIAIAASLESFYYDTLHSLEEKNRCINLAAPLMVSHIDVSSEKEPFEDFITHSKEGSCKLHEVSQEFDKFYDSVKKEIRSDNIKFNKSLMKFIKRYKKYSDS